MKTLILPLVLSALLLGCQKQVVEVEKPTHSTARTAVLGVDFSIATKTSITKAFSTANIGFLEAINKWEEQWTPGEVYPGASAIRVGFTEANKVAYFQYDFNDPAVTKTPAIFDTIKKQFGEPTGTDGELNSGGEYTANWELGDGIRVQVKRTYPKGTTHLSYFNDPEFEVLKLEYAIDARRAAEAENEKVSKMF